MIEARPLREDETPVACTGCRGAKGAPIAGVVTIGPGADLHPTLQIAADAAALGRVKEAGKIIDEFNARDEFVFVDPSMQIVLCEECGRDLANAVGFLCLRDGGWSKLEPRKRKTPELAECMGCGAPVAGVYAQPGGTVECAQCGANRRKKLAL
jgi:ribosomal protein S27E